MSLVDWMRSSARRPESLASLVTLEIPPVPFKDANSTPKLLAPKRRAASKAPEQNVPLELPLVWDEDCGLCSRVPGSKLGVAVRAVLPTRDTAALPPKVKPPAGAK